MKKAGLKMLRKHARLIVVGLLAVFFSAGCDNPNFPRIASTIQDFGPSYQPSNIYRASNTLPPNVRRVAVLPLSTSGNSDAFDAGIETLEPVLHAELEKTKRFEVVYVSGDQLRHWTGRGKWRMDEALPATLFTNICETTGCDAVLFSQLTRYQAYQPPAIGWKFNLIQTPRGNVPGTDIKSRTLWSADELLDAGNPTVSNAARSYYMKQIHSGGPAPDASTVLSSPTRFGQYTLSTLLETLPVRTP